ncbi:MAG: sn-glycerol-1-phosphate dehydrogenase [Clostridia bacterium]|nr:sn-glycerol-1-phosphate dehydrogenase [Clostridia bacterium]
MDLSNLLAKLQNCPCGKKHECDLKDVAVGSGLLKQTAEILKKNNFPTDILVVADNNTLKAADGILDILKTGGFHIKTKFFDDLRVAEYEEAENIAKLSADVDGILSVGTGSLNDICRRAAFVANKDFAIFATAPSMDGFASVTSPLTANNFKISYPAKQPSVIIGDTAILAKAPAELKSAGFGDMIAKYTALTDWKLAKLTVGEAMCENVASVTRDGLMRAVSLADKVTSEDEEAAGAIFEGLILTGLAMKLGDTTRAASGAEHVVSHFWECKKLEQGLLSDFHGKKCGVATLMCIRLYKELAKIENPVFVKDSTDWDKVYEIYGENFRSEVEKYNTPTVTDETSPEILTQNWQEIRRIINEELPSVEELTALMKQAGCATTAKEIGVADNLAVLGLQYHPYMRHRMMLTRLVPMFNGIKIDWNTMAGI